MFRYSKNIFAKRLARKIKGKKIFSTDTSLHAYSIKFYSFFLVRFFDVIIYTNIFFPLLKSENAHSTIWFSM
jgi:hypothetical protein